MTSPDMTTQIWPVNASQPDPATIAAAAAILRAGGLVAFPTETVYGLGANALDAVAVARIFAAKGRPASDPIIVHVHALAQLDYVAVVVPDAAYQLAQAFWPGPLTLVLRRAAAIPGLVSAGRDTVAVRMPSHPVAMALLRAAGVPVGAPSANRFSRPSATSARHVQADLEGRIEAILDAGPTPIGVESTIVDLTSVTPEVLRPGGIPVEALRALLPNLTVVSRHYAADASAIEAPGMLLRHYSPRAEIRLFAGPQGPVRDAMQREAADLAKADRSFGLLIPDAERVDFAPAASVSTPVGNTPDEISRHLFEAMRSLDQQGAAVILAHLFEPVGMGLALNDRLFRAAEGRVIQIL